jgi:hypothetical protein
MPEAGTTWKAVEEEFQVKEVGGLKYSQSPPRGSLVVIPIPRGCQAAQVVVASRRRARYALKLVSRAGTERR